MVTALSARLSTLTGSIVVRGAGRMRVVTVVANGADLFLGALVTKFGETGDDVDLCVKGEPVSGIIIGTPYGTDLSKDSDDPYADNTELLMAILEPGMTVWAVAKVNTAIDKNTRCQVDGGFCIPFAYVDAAVATDTLVSVIGSSNTAITATADTTKYFKVEIGGL